jgi:hypothetical protein
LPDPDLRAADIQNVPMAFKVVLRVISGSPEETGTPPDLLEIDAGCGYQTMFGASPRGYVRKPDHRSEKSSEYDELSAE